MKTKTLNADLESMYYSNKLVLQLSCCAHGDTTCCEALQLCFMCVCACCVCVCVCGGGFASENGLCEKMND